MSKEDKTFDLMEKMYIEFTEKFNKIDKRFDSIENEVKKTNMKIENNIQPKIKSLFDGYKQTNEKLDATLKIVNSLSQKVEQQEIKLNLVK